MAGGVASEVAQSDISHQSAANVPATNEHVLAGEQRLLARTSTALEGGTPRNGRYVGLRVAAQQRRATVLGVTGKGDSGKSSLVDELPRGLDLEGMPRGAVLAVRSTRRRAGGALPAPPCSHFST